MGGAPGLLRPERVPDHGHAVRGGTAKRADQPRAPSTPGAASAWSRRCCSRWPCWPSTPTSCTWPTPPSACGGTAWRRCSTTPTTARPSGTPRSSATWPRPGRSRWRSSSTSCGHSPWWPPSPCTGGAWPTGFAIVGMLLSTADRLLLVYHGAPLHAGHVQPRVLRLRHPGGRPVPGLPARPAGRRRPPPRLGPVGPGPADGRRRRLGRLPVLDPGRGAAVHREPGRVVAADHDGRLGGAPRLLRDLPGQPGLAVSSASASWSSSATSPTPCT